MLYALLYQRGGKSRQYGSRAAENFAVNHLRLSEIRDLCRPADVSGSWQQEVLKDRPQQHVGTKLFRMPSQLGLKLRRSEVTRADAKSIFIRPQSGTPSLIDKEKQRAILDFSNLGMITGGCKLPISLGNCRGKLLLPLDCRKQHWLAN